MTDKNTQGPQQATRFESLSDSEKRQLIDSLCDALFNLTSVYANELTVNQVCWNNDAVTEIGIGFLKGPADSTYGEELQAKKFTLTFNEALEIAETRLHNTFGFGLFGEEEESQTQNDVDDLYESLSEKHDALLDCFTYTAIKDFLESSMQDGETVEALMGLFIDALINDTSEWMKDNLKYVRSEITRYNEEMEDDRPIQKDPRP